MLIASIRPAEKHTATVTGTEIPELRAQLVAEAPAGWEMVSAHVEMKPGGIRIVEGKFQRRDEPREIEGEIWPRWRQSSPRGGRCSRSGAHSVLLALSA